MGVSIFDHLECEQRKLLATRTIHNNDRVSALETWDFGQPSACQTTELQNEAEVYGTERERGHLQSWLRVLVTASFSH